MSTPEQAHSPAQDPTGEAPPHLADLLAELASIGTLSPCAHEEYGDGFELTLGTAEEGATSAILFYPEKRVAYVETIREGFSLWIHNVQWAQPISYGVRLVSRTDSQRIALIAGVSGEISLVAIPTTPPRYPLGP